VETLIIQISDKQTIKKLDKPDYMLC